MDRPASLDVVEHVVRHELDAQERRAEAADTRAGLVLGFSGLIVSLGSSQVSPALALTSRVFATLAGLAALGTLFAGRPAGLRAQVLVEDLLDADPVHARLLALDLMVDAHHRSTTGLLVKLARLRLAARLLGASATSSLAGAIAAFVA